MTFFPDHPHRHIYRRHSVVGRCSTATAAPVLLMWSNCVLQISCCSLTTRSKVVMSALPCQRNCPRLSRLLRCHTAGRTRVPVLARAEQVLLHPVVTIPNERERRLARTVSSNLLMVSLAATKYGLPEWSQVVLSKLRPYWTCQLRNLLLCRFSFAFPQLQTSLDPSKKDL